MSLSESIQNMVHDAKSRKEMWVEEHPDQTDMPTMIVAYRDGEAVAQAFSLPDRDKMLQVVSIMCFGHCAYEITAAFEAYHTNLDKNPITDEEWGPNEMAFIAKEHNGIELGWVTEAVNLHGYSRTGEFFMATLPFTTKEGEVTWSEEKIIRSDQMTDVQRVDGYVHQNMLAYITGPTVEDRAREDLGEEGFEQLKADIGEDRLIHSDIATVKFILNIGIAVASGLCAHKDSERAKRIDVLMKRSIAKDERFKILYDATNN